MTTRNGVDRCRVTALPSAISEEEYDLAAAEIEDQLASLPGVVAVYSTGGRSAPGISDVDRIAVLERPISIDTAWAKLSERTREIAMHSPFVVDVDTFGRHRWFAHLEPLDLVSGDPVSPNRATPGPYGLKLLGVEGLVVGLLKLLKQRNAGRLKARPLLCELHALRHSLKLAGLAPETAPAAWRLIKDVDQVRRTWFQLPTPEQEASIRAMAGQGPAALLEALGGLQPADRAGNALPAPLPMSSPWGNVTIVPSPAGADPPPAFRIPRTAGLVSRSRRLPELRWRMRPRRVAVPWPAYAWLRRPQDPATASLRDQRDRLVLRYEAFVDACGGRWSSIGLARSFLPR